MASVIGGLPDLSGFIKSQNLVVSATFPYIGAERRVTGFIPRPIKALDLSNEAEAMELGTAGCGTASGSPMENREIEVSVPGSGDSA
jgi:hypothetical protein